MLKPGTCKPTPMQCEIVIYLCLPKDTEKRWRYTTAGITFLM
ncbi:hypothetical protein B6N60_04304 [Richelia sinica FACHB-800]|uniref:Uncharacterized protein n=1 Tax=Richelia sinica FACHB-800 TaxID=1357546 RepID=A0A975TBK2_9NOST|nr:hypothetical protein B6N60_04304 [Richelia sinica FACHB-800]